MAGKNLGCNKNQIIISGRNVLSKIMSRGKCAMYFLSNLGPNPPLSKNRTFTAKLCRRPRHPIPPHLQCHHMFFCGIRGPPSWAWQKCNRLLRLGRPWGAVSCPTDVWVVIEEDVVPGGFLNLNSTNLPRSWSPWESSPSRKLPTVEPGIETRTSWLVVRNSHEILTVYFHITPLVIS